ncbi:hypothetical protein BKA58DRAFT_389746 [Alternaria rosae]|uniref:uncharacterized protein n=1 Tax=Alternaria rosae TaxID=1187941 RepID=UPI001E8E5444|nr:uncharacterized protein BKA58DRAFT_389746 [Alternaria rosae]KAH6865576.1 hypothetical protein BKA58DRAFT_389746 [Alternaria rosae]
MVLSILIATIVAPGLLGSQEAIRQSQSKEKREEHRARRCNLIATCVKSSPRSREINGRQVVLRNGKLWIDTGTEDGSPLGHPYAGYYLPYPDTNYEGLVTTITDVAPIMNWVYVDRDTGEAKYGVRADAQPHLTGPFDCTRQDRRLTFDGWEGWCAVEQAPGLWGLYFDISDDGLKSRVAPGTRVLEIELSRKERRWKKEADERMADQTTKREVEREEDAPVEKPLGGEAVEVRPGVGAGVGDGKEEGWRPMKIPKSIFEDPPPVVESLVFRSRTPPPAYEAVGGGEEEISGPGRGRDRASAEVSGMGQSINPTPPVVTEPVQAEAQSSLAEKTEISSNEPNVAQAQSPPIRIDEVRGNPEKVDSPSSPEEQPTSSSEKRTTPKLNRSSGSRALAQAQKFEAMAAAQKTSPEAGKRSSKRGSRANSNTSSVYSNEDASLSVPSVSTQPQASPTPAPLALAVSKAKQAKALATRSQPSMTTEFYPAISQARSTSSAKPVISLPRRPNPNRSTPSPSLSPSSRRSTSQQSTQRHTPDRRQRDRSISEVSSPSSSRAATSRSSPRSSTMTSGRQSLARTMTSGKGNQGMSNRIGGGQGRGSASGVGRGVSTTSTGKGGGTVSTTSGRERAVKTGGRKTTSALFREIDDLVGLEDEGGKTK